MLPTNEPDSPGLAPEIVEGSKPKKKIRRRKATKLQAKIKTQAANKIMVRYRPYPHQAKFSEMLASGKRVVLFLGGIRSGKTTAGAYEALKQIYKYCRKPNLGWLVSPTYPMSLVTERAFEEAAGDLIIKKFRGERAYLLYPNRTSDVPFRVEVKSADNPDRLRGAGLGFIWGDEAAMFTEDTWKILLGRVLDTQGVIFLTTTPRGKNWLYDKVYIESEKNISYGVIKAKTIDNKFLQEADVRELRGQYSSDFARQELDAEFVSFEGLVYKSFDARIHIVNPITEFPKDAEMIGGIDVGYADPFVHLWIMKYNHRLYVVDEYYEKFKTMESHARAIRSSKWDQYVIRRWADPSGAQERADLDRYSIGTYPARNDIKAGIDSVVRMFETNRLFITSNCLNLLKEIAEYHYPSKEGRNSGEDPVDFANHTMDAMRYAIYSEINHAQAHPYITVGDDGAMQVHEGAPDYYSNRLEDWVRLPSYGVSYIEPED